MFERIASLAAAQSPVFRSKHAAGLVYRGRLLAVGFNRPKTHPKAAQYSKHEEAIYLHAELDCLLRGVQRYGLQKVSRCTMFVARVLQNGSLGSSCPCEGCERALRTFNVKKVWYTTERGWNEVSYR